MVTVRRSLVSELCGVGVLAVLLARASLWESAPISAGRLPVLEAPHARQSAPAPGRRGPAREPFYTVTDLGALDGSPAETRNVENSLRFRLSCGPLDRPASAGSGGAEAIRNRRAVGGSVCQVLGVNGRGQAAGQARTSPGIFHAVLYHEGRMADLGTLGAGPSAARAINDAGQVVGWSATSDPGNHAFLSDGSTMRDLGTLGGEESEAVAINGVGQIAGKSLTARHDEHAFLWYDGVMIDLGTLGGSDSAATGMNDAGEVIGTSITRAGEIHAFLHTSGAMGDLGTLGGPSSWAMGINDSGRIVGWSETASGESHAFEFSSGRMVDLNRRIAASAGWALTAAYGINDAGEIAGVGLLDGRAHAFLLQPQHVGPVIQDS